LFVGSLLLGVFVVLSLSQKFFFEMMNVSVFVEITFVRNQIVSEQLCVWF